VAVLVRQDRRPPVIRVVGELDLASAGLLTAMLDHVRRSTGGRAQAGPGPYGADIEVDLSRVTFADSCGLVPVLDGRTRIVAASAPVRRVLRLLSALDPGDHPPAVPCAG
jgi:hypothetical protein